jgi:hypothetical protein
MNASDTTSNNRNSNKVAIKFLALLALWLLSFFPLYQSLISRWLNHSNNSHGILVPLISLYLIWQKKDELKTARSSNSNYGAIIMITSMIFYLFGYAGGIDIIPRTMIVFSLVGLILFTLGGRFSKSWLSRFSFFYL